MPEMLSAIPGRTDQYAGIDPWKENLSKVATKIISVWLKAFSNGVQMMEEPKKIVLEDVNLGLTCKGGGGRVLYGDGIQMGDVDLEDLVYIEGELLPVVEKIRRGLLRRSCERHGIPYPLKD